jgi:DNA-nicking Smr family endonuclease
VLRRGQRMKGKRVCEASAVVEAPRHKGGDGKVVVSVSVERPL